MPRPGVNIPPTLAAKLTVAALGALLAGCGSHSATATDGPVSSDAGDAVQRDAPAPDVDAPSADRSGADGPVDAGDASSASPWQNLTPTVRPAAWPSARADHAMVCDSKRNKLLVMGGTDGTGAVLADLWEWDIANGGWTNLTPSPLPPAWPPGRFVHAMAFDERRGVVVVFGGGGSGGNLSDTWEWDPAAGTWASRGGDPHPFGRYGMTLAYDPAGVVWLFSGAGDGGYSQEVWEWNGASGVWTDRTPSPLPATWPGPRTSHGAAFDTGRNRMIIFGGDDPSVSPLGDLWEWNPASGSFTAETPTPLPAAWPTARVYPGVAFASSAAKLILFAGLSGPGVGITPDVWTFDPAAATWSNLTPSPVPASWPSARAAHSVAYSAARDRLFVFGGQGFSGLMNELWTFDTSSL
jgi:hypothetical protein